MLRYLLTSHISTSLRIRALSSTYELWRECMRLQPPRASTAPSKMTNLRSSSASSQTSPSTNFGASQRLERPAPQLPLRSGREHKQQPAVGCSNRDLAA